VTKRPSRNGFAVLALHVLTQTEPPPLLQIHREGVKPGSEALYAEIESDTARICAAHGCPHPYLAIESLTSPTEVWFFNGYADAGEQKRVDDAYKGNLNLIELMTRNSARKAPITIEPRGVVARYRGTRGEPWTVGRGRFLVITVTKGERQIDGSVFETADGFRFIIGTVHTREQADAAAAAAGPETRVFAVRPRWSFPSKSWVAADEQFWRQ
jgi:hypothetical protein